LILSHYLDTIIEHDSKHSLSSLRSKNTPRCCEGARSIAEKLDLLLSALPEVHPEMIRLLEIKRRELEESQKELGQSTEASRASGDSIYVTARLSTRLWRVSRNLRILSDYLVSIRSKGNAIDQ